VKSVSCWLPFSLATLFACFGSVFIPYTKISPFAPFFAIIYQKLPFIPCLWISFICGILIDMISSQHPFGSYAIVYLACTITCYSQKRHFFEDKIISLCLYAALISSVSSLILIAYSFIFDYQFPITVDLLVSDGFIIPFFDAFYALAWFIIPIKAYQYLRSGNWKKYFRTKEETTE